MFFNSLLSSAFGDFIKSNYVWIILVATLLAILVIIFVTLRLKKKPSEYHSDEIDASVDRAAKEKAERRLELERADSQSQQSNRPRRKNSKVAANPSAPKEEVEEPEIKPAEAKPEVKSEAKPEVEAKGAKTKVEAKSPEAGTKDQNKQGKEAKSMSVEQKSEEEVVVKSDSKRPQSYRILYDKETETWEVRKDNAKRVIRRVKTKKEALEIAKKR